ncbi:hypothetical protein [Streptomyces sp. KAU_LT]|uniref:hypothetical protein n=1 Tax=Streptomyces sp. KAU_LT TaxID=3046669 RepID=UPI0024B71971|nr:hypothetical protein [Streptomyces sp. KAU_LT]MDI9832067.1 hypothetical protein [Streptomyces sp. KAU_LT]
MEIPISITRGPSSGTQNVRRFHVAADEARAVDGVQRLGRPSPQAAYRRFRQRAAAGNERAEIGGRDAMAGDPWGDGMQVGIDLHLD